MESQAVSVSAQSNGKHNHGDNINGSRRTDTQNPAASANKFTEEPQSEQQEQIEVNSPNSSVNT